MAYSRKKYGSTSITKGQFDNLGISWDYDTDPEKRFPLLFFTPNMNNTTIHYHIRLTFAQTRVLRNWLDKFLIDNEQKAPNKARKTSKRK